jgi:MSHA pilin protein MshD
MRSKNENQLGATLIELIVFIVIVGIALAATLKVFNQSIQSSNDPLIRIRALELGQAQLDDILSRKFDENTPTGGVPACDSAAGSACLGISPDSDFDDVGDFDGYVDSSYPGYIVSVSVSEAGGDLGITASQARLITVNISTPATSENASGSALTLSAYKVNF